MSAIVGIYHRTGAPVEAAPLQQMLQRLAHRGPDACLHWHCGPVGLGHRMLETTPEAQHETLPFTLTEAALSITADARLDNRSDLLAALGQRPGLPDSQLILAAYQKWGPACAAHLLGDFAFALWDARRERLFCARDVVGIKPFYYHAWSGGFAFASEIKGLLALGQVPRRLNEVKLGDYLVPVFQDQQSTYYRDVVRLPPAHALVVDRAGVRLWRYWQFDVSREERLGSEGAYVEAFRALFEEAVRCRLRGVGGVGSTLSGGLDSSAIACTARGLLASGERLHTYSAVFPSVARVDPRIDERRYVEAVLEGGGFEPHYVEADRCRPLADLLQLQGDEVVAAPNLYMTEALFKVCQGSGVRVLLSGFDGDVTVSYGYEYLSELARSGRWAEFARQAQALAQRRGHGNVRHYFRLYGLPYLQEMARAHRWWAFARSVGGVPGELGYGRGSLWWQGGVKAWVPSWVRRVRGGGESVGGLNRAISRSFARRIGLEERLEALRAQPVGSAYPLRQQHANSLTHGFMQYLEGRFDEMASRYGLEQRYPFFDRRLMEFCLALPPSQKLREGWTRAVLRYAMEGTVPPQVQWRQDKGNLGANIRLQLFAERALLERVIWGDAAVIESYVDVGVLREVYGRFVGDPVSSSEEDLFTLFLSVALACWLQQTGLTP